MIYTKEQLEGMSDFALNWIIASSLPPTASVIYFVSGKRLMKTDARGEVAFSDEVDYCNNPNDIMPLAFEAGISLVTDEDRAKGERWCSFSWYNGDYEAWHTNPLRAIAIVYILVKQGDGE